MMRNRGNTPDVTVGRSDSGNVRKTRVDRKWERAFVLEKKSSESFDRRLKAKEKRSQLR